MTSSRADRLLGLAVLLAGGMVLVLGGTLVQRSRVETDFHQACSAISTGDPLVSIFETLGLEGYRPGCGIDLPCSEFTLPGHEEPISWFCEDKKCTLLWRRSGDTCFVSLDATSLRASGPGLLRELPF